ncbi:MAG: UDP-N-acetylmuramate dehydrogenase [Acutalibacteraceae bacterium]
MSLDALKEFCEKNSVEYKINEPMSCHTSFKIGGAADIFISVRSSGELSAVFKKCGELDMPRLVIGKGSNLLVSDSGVEGAVISLLNMNGISVEGEEITCGAGAALSDVCRAALDNSLTGLEFAYGIPGSIGGAVYMNAGAYGGEMADVILSAECLARDGSFVKVNASDMNFGYRKSVFKENGMTVLSAVLRLKKSDKKEIEAKMDDYIYRRKSKQPLEYPSAGSFFKRPTGYFAGALIEKNGLKGETVGGAQVSEKHAGFIINRGGATCEDVKKLGKNVSDRVFAADGVRLEPEVIFIGREGKGE